MAINVDQVDWKSLSHAFGPATDVPRHLAALASPDAGVREAGLDALYGTIWNEGSLYPATPAAVPVLLALVADDATAERPLLLLLLADIGRAAWFGDDPWYVDAQIALAAGVSTLERRLESTDPVERIAATVALAWADDGAALVRRFGVGDDAERMVTVYALAAGRSPPNPDWLESLALSDEPALGLAARIGLVRAGHAGALGRIEPNAYASLAEVIATVAPEALPQPVELLDPASVDPASVRSLAKVLARTASFRVSVPLVQFLLGAVFPDGYEEPPSPDQLEVLEAVARSPGAWVYPAHAVAALSEQGLDVLDQGDLCARLGLAAPDRPEREDTSMLLGTSEWIAVRYEELGRQERDLLERFVDTLDGLGWNETRHWHQFVTGGSGLPISPIGVGRHFNEHAVLECTLWLFDEHVAADSGERVGDPYVRLVLTDKAERRPPLGFRAYHGDRLVEVLEVIDRHRPTVTVDGYSPFLHDLFDVVSRVELELADGRVAEIRPKATS
ncbi:MAG: hypothetical protein ABMA64_09815 [Myxococcota bacterium]